MLLFNKKAKASYKGFLNLKTSYVIVQRGNRTFGTAGQGI